MKVLDEAGDGIEALEKLNNNRFDLVLLDISLPRRNGLEILKEIKLFYLQRPVKNRRIRFSNKRKRI